MIQSSSIHLDDKRIVPLPRQIIERLPFLKDSDIRLLLLVVSQTIGYGKERDWISQAWFKEKAGLSSASVSGAIDLLVRRRLIRVTNEEGFERHTKLARRLHRGKLYYCLGPALGYPQSLSTDYPKAKRSQVQNPNTTSIGNINNKDKFRELSTVKVRTGWVKAGDVPLERRER